MMALMRRGAAWLFTLLLAAAGSQFAHAVDYRLVQGDPQERADLLAATGHGYLEYLPLALALGLALVLTQLAVEVSRARHHAGWRPRVWVFALVAPLAFAIQEHLERLLHDGSVPWSAALEPTFLPGLALQLPFAVVAYVVARLLLSVARTLGRFLGTVPRARRLPVRSLDPSSVALRAPRVAALALGYGVRGPPLRV